MDTEKQLKKKNASIFFQRMRIKKQMSALLMATDPEICLDIAEKVKKDVHVMALDKRAYLLECLKNEED